MPRAQIAQPLLRSGKFVGRGVILMVKQHGAVVKHRPLQISAIEMRPGQVSALEMRPG